MGASRRTLIAFLYHESASRERHSTLQLRTNLEFFLREGVSPAMHNLQYHFAIVLTSPCVTPRIPINPRVTVHDLNTSQGFEMFNFKRFLSESWCTDARRADGCTSLCANAPGERVVVEMNQFDHFVLVADTVRGPFLPNYVSAETWPDLLTSQLSPSVKLVGPSVNCMGCDNGTPRACKTRLHSEGHLMVADRTGMEIMATHWRRPGHKGDSVGHNEIGMSKAIFDRGYSIGSLQLFWRGHDFRDAASTQRKCRLLRSHAHNDRNGTRRVPQSWYRRTGVDTVDSVDRGGGHAHCMSTHANAMPVVHRSVSNGWIALSGLVSCPGCYWNGTDLSPFETLFVHSPTWGDVVAYTSIHEALAHFGSQHVEPPPEQCTVLCPEQHDLKALRKKAEAEMKFRKIVAARVAAREAARLREQNRTSQVARKTESE